MRFYFVRHAESVNNVQGGGDSRVGSDGDRLSEKGEAQAHTVGQRLKDENIGKIISSQMRRARETSESIGQTLGVSTEEYPDIHEYQQGERWYAKDRKPSDAFQDWMPKHDDRDYHPKGAESFNQITNRVRSMMGMLEQEPTGKNILIVTHGNFLRFFLAEVLLLDYFEPKHIPLFWNVETNNTGISIFTQGEGNERVFPQFNGWHLETWMDHGHL